MKKKPVSYRKKKNNAMPLHSPMDHCSSGGTCKAKSSELPLLSLRSGSTMCIIFPPVYFNASLTMALISSVPYPAHWERW